jgi:hypothetical protein
MPDTTTKEPEDLREVIINKHKSVERKQAAHRMFGSYNFEYLNLSSAREALDDYFTQRSMELLEWLYENDVSFDQGIYEDRGENKFYYKGEWITKEQLFENFL